MSREAMKQALDALEQIDENGDYYDRQSILTTLGAIRVLKAALAKPVAQLLTPAQQHADELLQALRTAKRHLPVMSGAWDAANEAITKAEDTPTPVAQGDHHPDDEAVDQFAALLKAKLEKAREKGRSGWRDPAWPASDISRQLHEHAAKGDPLDVAAYAMFLALRGEPTQAAPVAQPDPMMRMAQALEVADGEWRKSDPSLRVGIAAALAATAPLAQGEPEMHCMNCAAFGQCHSNNDAGRCGYEPDAAPAPVAQPLTVVQIIAEAQGRYTLKTSTQAFVDGAVWAALHGTGGAA